MVDSPVLSDLTILTGKGSHVKAHGCILAARCPGFRQAVLAKAGAGAPRVLDLSEFPCELVMLYLEQVYTAAVVSHSELDQRSRRGLQAIANK